MVYDRYLLPLLLQYDSTAEESDMTESHGVGASVQIAKNMHAIQASLALSRISGLCSDGNSTPYNRVAAYALRALLTPKLSSLLKDQMPKDLLSKLNTNLETPEVNTFSPPSPFILSGKNFQYGSPLFLWDFYHLKKKMLCILSLPLDRIISHFAQAI